MKIKILSKTEIELKRLIFTDVQTVPCTIPLKDNQTMGARVEIERGSEITDPDCD